MTHRFSEQAQRGPARDYVLEVWQRRKWVALALFSAALAAAITVTRSLPDLYRATATVLVERQQVSEAFVTSSVTAELETRIQTIREQVMSRARLTELIHRLDLYPELRGKASIEGLIGRMRRDVQLDFKRVEQTSGRPATIAFTLSYSGRDPATVTRAANTLAALFVEENTRIRARQAARTADFLKGQLADVRRDLEAQERRTNEFRLRHDGELPEQFGVTLATLERLNSKLRLNGESQSRAVQRRERLEEQIAATSSGTSSVPAAPGTRAAQLLKLKQELADLRRQYSDRYPDVIRVKAEIAALEQQLAEDGDGHGSAPGGSDMSKRLRQALGEVENELRSLKSEEDFLRQAVATHEARMENAPKLQQELQELSTDYGTSKERYDSLLKRYEEAQLADNLEQGQDVEQIRILDPAIEPGSPAAPNRELLLMIGLFASLALAFGAVVAAERLDTSFHTLDDLRAFVNIPVLATVRLIPARADARRRRRVRVLLAVLFVVGLALIVAGAHYVADGNEQIVRRMARTAG